MLYLKQSTASQRRAVPGFDGLYEVTDEGEVWSCRKKPIPVPLHIWVGLPKHSPAQK